MKVFISWSGAQSRAIAQALREWLPFVIQAVEPWMSDVDIGKGTRWSQEIGVGLAQTSFGIICLTADNLNAPWINFEAGAISKTLEGARVCTYLYNLKPTDVDGPLSQFNHTRVDKDETRKLIHAVNQGLGPKALSDQFVDHLFETLWPQFEEKLNNLPPPESIQRPDRPMEDMIEELLELVRSRLRPQPVDEPAIASLFDSVCVKILLVRETMDKIEQACVTLDKGGSTPLKLPEVIDSTAIASFGKGNGSEALQLLKTLGYRASDSLNARSYLSAGTILLRNGDLSEARRLYTEAVRACLITNNQYIAFLISLNLAMISSLEGNRYDCLKILESERKRAILVRSISPVGYFTYLNTLAVEKSEMGHVEEALSLIQKPLASPFAVAYPEWQETRTEILMGGTARITFKGCRST